MAENVLILASELMSLALALVGQYCIATVQPMRHRRAFLAASYALAVLSFVMMDTWEWASSLYTLVFYLILPLALLRGSVWRRLLSLGVGLAPTAATELVVCLMVIALYDGDISPAFARQEAGFMLVYRLCALALTLLYVRWARALLGEMLERERADRGIWYFSAGVFLHAALSLAVYLVMAKAGTRPDGPLLLIALLSVALLMLVSALLLAHIERVRIVAVEQARLQVAQEQLDAALAQYDKVAHEAVRMARLRHDARNHLFAIGELVAAGRGERALAYANEMIGLLRAGEKDLGPDLSDGACDAEAGAEGAR